tara:strand:+ start:206 stop:571 length:366 start_codon:yes stop_codon:yes gene_type:complete
MGLDQYAYKRKSKWNKGYKVRTMRDEQIMYWRKHSKLQQWYVETFDKDHGEVYLNEEHIKEIRELTENNDMPNCDGGFFWGHQFQNDPDHKKYVDKDTLEFCDKAEKALKEGCDIIYECSW